MTQILLKDQLRKLGRYTLLDRLAEGGSAEVYRGMLDRGNGVQRLVAVKCIHREHAEDQVFLDFFRDETKLSVGLKHVNIVQTLDYGEEDGLPFIVFEFVHGRSVKQIVDRLGKLGKPFPVELLVYICEQTAAGLHYAHAFEDPASGKILNIIHRDISPHNVMVSYDGIPKIIDFGIAKVLQRGDQTKAGLIKGKPAYLSPEQALGRPVDCRSDIFSLGTMTWEALTGRRLFGGMDKASTLRAISDETVVIAPPSMINPSTPNELDEIVLRALQRDPNKRFATANDVHLALLKLLEARPLEYWQGELSSLLNNIFSDDIVHEKAELRRLGAVAEEITRSVLTDPSWLIPVVVPASRRSPGMEKTLTREFQIWDVTQSKIQRPASKAAPKAAPRTSHTHTHTHTNKKPAHKPPSKTRYATYAGLTATIAAAAFFVLTSTGPSASPPPAPVAPASPQAVTAPPRTTASVPKKRAQKHRQKKPGRSKKTAPPARKTR